MNEYSMTCSCGEVISVDAKSREDAISMLKDKMNEEAIINHISESHSGESAPTLQEVHSIIDKTTQQVF